MVNKRKLSKRRTYGKKLSKRFKKMVSKRVSKRVSKKRFSKRFSKKRMKKRQYNKYVKRGGSSVLDQMAADAIEESRKAAAAAEREAAAKRDQREAALPPYEMLLLENMAERLGIDTKTEDYLMWIAEKALDAPLLMGWVALEDPETGKTYYGNTKNRSSTWYKPIDDREYKSMVLSYRKPVETGRNAAEEVVLQPPNAAAGAAAERQPATDLTWHAKMMEYYNTPQDDPRTDTQQMRIREARAAKPENIAAEIKRDRALRAKKRKPLDVVNAWLDVLEEKAAQRNAEAAETVRMAKEETAEAEHNLEKALAELQDYVTKVAKKNWGVARTAVKTATTVVGQDQKIVCQAANRLRDISLPQDDRGYEYYNEDNPFPLGNKGFAIVKNLIHGAYHGYIIFPNEETDPRRSYIKTILDYLVDH